MLAEFDVATKTIFSYSICRPNKPGPAPTAYPPPENLTRFDLGDKGLVLVVSDGMGGALAGDVASRMAVDSVREMLMGEGDEACDPDDRSGRVFEERDHLRQSRDSSAEPGRLTLRRHGRNIYRRRDQRRQSGSGPGRRQPRLRDSQRIRFAWQRKISHWCNNSSTLVRSANRKPRRTCFAT